MDLKKAVQGGQAPYTMLKKKEDSFEMKEGAHHIS
jgi:hypothetical protein